jgi:hypothetical protein
LRKGSTNSVRGAAKLLTDALATARRAGATGLVIVRADSAFYSYDIINSCRRAGARFSITARHTPTVTRAITTIPDTAWVPIRYPNAIWDDDEQRWISDAEVAEIEFTAFTSRRKSEHITASLIVRRVRRLNPTTVRRVSRGSGAPVGAYRAPIGLDPAKLLGDIERTTRHHAGPLATSLRDWRSAPSRPRRARKARSPRRALGLHSPRHRHPPTGVRGPWRLPDLPHALRVDPGRRPARPPRRAPALLRHPLRPVHRLPDAPGGGARVPRAPRPRGSAGP